MSTSSKFFQLSSSILLEYIYADQSDLNSHKLPTSTYPIYKYNGVQLGDPLNHTILHGSKEYRQDNCYLRDVSNRIKRMRNLFDPTDVLNLPGESPVYDKIRIHLIQGFNYESHNGFDLKLSLLTNYQNEVSLLQFVTYSGDKYWTMNPVPFMMGGKQYTSYIELNVLSSYNLIFDYYFGDRTIVNAITHNGTNTEGLKQEQNIQCKFSWLDKKEVLNNIEYAYESESVLFDIVLTDNYSNLGASIKQSNEFDYIEYGGTLNGDIQAFDNFIRSLNNNGNSFILLHNLIVSEFINISGTEPYWLTTETLDISQIDNFDVVNTFRPIIKNYNAIAFRIDYILRLYNRVDNSQIVKNGSMISYDVNKYGKTLYAIQLDSNPVQNVIYNKNVIKNITMNKVEEPSVISTKTVLSLVNNNNIVLAAKNITSIPSGIFEGTQIYDVNKTYPDGLAKIIIYNTTSYLKFNIFEYRNGTLIGSDLSGLGKGFLSFDKGNGNKIEIAEYDDSNLGINKTNGEILFRISEIDANRILNLTNREFSIIFQQQDNLIDNTNIKREKITKCSGTFYSQGEWSSILELSASEKYKEALSFSNSTLNEKDKTIKELESKVSTITAEKTRMLSEYQIENTSNDDLVKRLQSELKNSKTIIESKDARITELMNELNLLRSNPSIIKTYYPDDIIDETNNEKTPVINSPVIPYIGGSIDNDKNPPLNPRNNTLLDYDIR